MLKSKKWVKGLGFLVIFTIVSAILITVCMNVNAQTLTKYSSTKQISQQKNPKYVFLFIGDGNAMAQINAAENFLGSEKGKNPYSEKLSFSKFQAQGMTTTYSSDSFITDSAAAGTAIATGHKTNSGEISMSPDKKISYKTIAELAKEQGKKVGIVTTTTINHATPAVFYAHNESRRNYYNIGVQLAKSNFDYFAGGAISKNKGRKGDQIDVYKIAEKEGYKIVNKKNVFEKLTAKDGKILATSPILDNDGSIPYSIDQDENVINLADFTRKGIELLDNDKGFFMMVEGGKIDWACHANDAASSIYETLAFDAAVQEAIKFYRKHPHETLIVVTGDHETGGLALGFAGTGYSNFYEKIKNQKISYYKFTSMLNDYFKEKGNDVKFADVMNMITENFGLNADKNDIEMGLSNYELQQLKDAFQIRREDKALRRYSDKQELLYGGYDPITVTVTHILNQKSGIAWTSYSHTGIPVPTFAQGQYSQLFNGYYDNTEIFNKLKEAMNIKYFMH